jgi:hypothetical protein
MLALRVFCDVWTQLLNIICISVTLQSLDAELMFQRYVSLFNDDVSGTDDIESNIIWFSE